MTHPRHNPTELEVLLELLCEDRLTQADAARLEELVLSSPEARWTYLTYMDLHGTLYWDAAGAGSPEPLSSEELPVYAGPVQPPPSVRAVTPAKTHRRGVGMMAAVALCLGVVTWGLWRLPGTQPPAEVTQVAPEDRGTDRLQSGTVRDRIRRSPKAPVTVGNISPAPRVEVPENATPAAPNSTESVVAQPPMSTRAIVTRINEEIESRWTEIGVQPSLRADDAEWLRRIYLDLAGRVPTVTESQTFLADKSDDKREALIEVLLEDSAYVRNFTTKWSNLLIGRASNPLVNREAFAKFLRMSFAENRPWNQIVADLISAEGNNSENGATNFLIAHLNNAATPATAVCSKLFLGRQLHCNQCHNHPFNETKQVEFWELNSFFQQTASVRRIRRDQQTGRQLAAFTELVTRDAGGPTYFETRTGLMRVAYPRFNGTDVDPGAETNRRRELARLMTTGEQPDLASAFVNRMWDHFFGIGFTRELDTLGPHQVASHPELLEVLSAEFIRSGYDIKQLVRWICRSEPYQLSSRFSESNRSDDPSLGDIPAFSRMYVRSMTAEQTYDSFLTATKAHQVGAVDWVHAEQNRQQWLRQFVVSYNTDENDEAMTFDGSIGNALSLMNGPLIEKALDLSAGSFLGEVVRQRSSETEKIRSLCLATLSRLPEPNELSSMKKLLRDAATTAGKSANGAVSPAAAYQDLFWALLNSNEFASIH
ncbi:DUF1549 domain-containing protein [Schlesneria sp. T3-172]|uniref:DUF1549 domain-containing protein n=1 Tax=Schlesneria sphaerica TaxID=3373610 RepID=UPI0037C9A832